MSHEVRPSGAAARALPRRALLPSAVVIAAALAVSLGAHLQAYVGLGLLDLTLPPPPAAAALPPMEVELIGVPVEPTVEEPDDAEVAEVDEDPEVEPPPPEPRRRRERQAAAPPPAPEPPPPEIPPVVPPAAQPPPPSQPQPEERTSVSHRSRDPNVEPPPEALHLAEENSRVEEETMARIRNPNLDDDEPQAPAPDAPTPPSEEEGDAAEELQEELADADGSEERDPTVEETRLRPEPDRQREASRSRTPSQSEAAQGEARQGGDDQPARERQVAGGGRRARGGGEVPTQEIIVSDGHGSFVVRVPIAPAGEGEGEGGGPAVAGRGQGTQGEGRRAGHAGRGRGRARSRASRGRGAPNLRVSWSQFSTLYGEEELERERELYIAQRRSRTQGANRQERWRRFRAAIENYDVRVRPGNQTALNTRADPFAAYIASMHRRIHPRFAEGYLRNVPAEVNTAFASNDDMHTKLELAVDSEGRVDHVSVVSTSGQILFDLGSYEAVMGAQPFEAPPESIRSPDGLVYMHWSFYRNHRQCGTFNAQAFILAAAPPPRRGASPTPPTSGPEFTPGGPEPTPPGGPDGPPRSPATPASPERPEVESPEVERP